MSLFSKAKGNDDSEDENEGSREKKQQRMQDERKKKLRKESLDRIKKAVQFDEELER